MTDRLLFCGQSNMQGQYVAGHEEEEKQQHTRAHPLERKPRSQSLRGSFAQKGLFFCRRVW